MCLKCEVSMCKEHLKPHMELPAFRGHPLVEPHADLRVRRCPQHEEAFRYYCVEEQVCLCSSCIIVGEHSGHTIKTLKDTMKDMKVRPGYGLRMRNLTIRSHLGINLILISISFFAIIEQPKVLLCWLLQQGLVIHSPYLNNLKQ